MRSCGITAGSAEGTMALAAVAAVGIAGGFGCCCEPGRRDEYMTIRIAATKRNKVSNG